MENDRRETPVARHKLEGPVYERISARVEHTYKLAEHIKHYSHCRKRDQGGKEFDIAEVREAMEGEILQGCRYCNVPCHCGRMGTS